MLLQDKDFTMNKILEKIFKKIKISLKTLQYTCALENNCLTFSLYAPYWILNQTTLNLEYKVNLQFITA